MWFVKARERLNHTDLTARLTDVTAMTWLEMTAGSLSNVRKHPAYWFLKFASEYCLVKEELAGRFSNSVGGAVPKVEAEEWLRTRPEASCPRCGAVWEGTCESCGPLLVYAKQTPSQIMEQGFAD